MMPGGSGKGGTTVVCGRPSTDVYRTCSSAPTLNRSLKKYSPPIAGPAKYPESFVVEVFVRSVVVVVVTVLNTVVVRV